MVGYTIVPCQMAVCFSVLERIWYEVRVVLFQQCFPVKQRGNVTILQPSIVCSVLRLMY